MLKFKPSNHEFAIISITGAKRKFSRRITGNCGCDRPQRGGRPSPKPQLAPQLRRARAAARAPGAQLRRAHAAARAPGEHPRRGSRARNRTWHGGHAAPRGAWRGRATAVPLPQRLPGEVWGQAAVGARAPAARTRRATAATPARAPGSRGQVLGSDNVTTSLAYLECQCLGPVYHWAAYH